MKVKLPLKLFNSSNKKTIIVLFFIFIVIIGLTAYFIFLKPSIIEKQQSKYCNQQGYEYILQSFKTTDRNTVLHHKLYFDQRLLRINLCTRKEEVVIKSIKSVIPEAKIRDIVLLEFVQSDFSPVIFKSYIDGTGDPGGYLYKFNTKTYNLEKMKINKILNGFGGFALSPMQDKFILVPNDNSDGDDKIMYLINLNNDTYEELVSLENNETFNCATSGYDTCHEISWLSDNKIIYGVYDQTKKGTNFVADDTGINSILINYRIAIIDTNQ